MRLSTSLLVTLGVTIGSVLAARAEDMSRLAEAVEKPVDPLPGLEKAPLRAPAWCTGKSGASFSPGSVGRHLTDIRYPLDALPEAAEQLCAAPPNDPTVQKAAQFVEQSWINLWGVSSKDAVETIRHHFDKNALEATKSKLCGALKVSAEVGGPEKAFNAAKRDLFDCGGDSIRMVATAPMLELVAWLDASGTPPDAMVRFAALALEAQGTLGNEDYRDKSILFTIMDQVDAKTFAPDQVLALLAQPPYAGNIYAQATVKESLGLYLMRQREIDADVVARTAKDAGWKQLLVTAPQQGIAAFTAASAKWKAELQRSADFEQLAFGPSQKALAGCQGPLKKDLQAVLKSLKHGTVDELVAAAGEGMVAGVLLQRYIVCLASDGEPMIASGFRKHLPAIRTVRGPRVAAYYAALDALNAIREDRAKFPVEAQDLPFDRTEILEALALEILSNKKYDTVGFTDVGSGIVKSAKKGPKGVAIDFQPKKRQIYTESCTTTNRIVMFDHDGQPIYYRKCKPTGLQWIDEKPAPILISEAQAAGIKAGVLLDFAVVPYNYGDRLAMPLHVFADKKGKKLTAFFGIGPL